MDTSINAINSVTPQAPQVEKTDKNAERIKQSAEKYGFEYFDIDKDGKISGTEATKLKMIFNSVSFDKDDEEAIDESAFNSALSDYKE